MKKPRAGSNGAVTTPKLKGMRVTGTQRRESHGEQATLRGAVTVKQPKLTYR